MNTTRRLAMFIVVGAFAVAFIGAARAGSLGFSSAPADSCTLSSYLSDEGLSLSPATVPIADSELRQTVTDTLARLFPRAVQAQTMTGKLSAPNLPVADGRMVELVRITGAAAMPPGGPIPSGGAAAAGSAVAACTVVAVDATTGELLYAVQLAHQ